MTTFDIQRLRDLAGRASKGPWIRSGVRHKLRDADCLMVGPDGFMIAAVPVGRLPKEHAGAFNDAGFIAACDPQTIIALCDAAEAARGDEP